MRNVSPTYTPTLSTDTLSSLHTSPPTTVFLYAPPSPPFLLDEMLRTGLYTNTVFTNLQQFEC